MKQSQENHENNEHIVDIPNDGGASSSISSIENPTHGSNLPNHELIPSGNSQVPVIQVSSSFSNRSNTRNSQSFFWLWISIKLVFTTSQIVASIVVLIFSRHEKPEAPLFVWIVGYTAGCAASIPTLFRHYFLPHPRLCRLVDVFKGTLDFFFVIWFVVGNVWIFGGYSSSEAPNLYRLCLVFLAYSYITYAVPFILYTIILCCCGGLNQIRGATAECINSLPTYEFKLQKNGSGSTRRINSRVDDGVVAAGTERERPISGDDAVCCICLASYVDNDELKELPCSHFFHTGCVDKWLKMKAFCPLCKSKVTESNGGLPSAANSGQQV